MRLWQGSVSTTIALTVVIAMVLGFCLQQLVDAGLRELGLAREQSLHPSTKRLLRQLPGRVAALVDVVNKTPVAERATVISAAQLSELHVRLLDAPLPWLLNENRPNADLLRTRILAAMTVPRLLVVASRYQLADPQAGPGSKRVMTGALIEAPLLDGHWLLFESDLSPPPASDPIAIEFERVSLGTWLALSVLLAVLVSILAARRVARPLSELARAAEQLGGSGDAPPLPERGPREVRRTILAFNRMQERLRRFNEDRTRMIAAMSHDLRTPLTRLQLRLELVKDLDQQGRMSAELDRMGDMIESILSFARNDARREPQALVDLGALVAGICEEASDNGAAVTFSGPQGVTVSCRPTAMRRAIANIVENAVKYGTEAAVSLVPESGHVVVQVDDNGPGIPHGDRERAFEPFVRLEGSRNADTGGVGLGLSVARSILWEHGGDISLANRKGGGLSVRLELPSGAQSETHGRLGTSSAEPGVEAGSS